MTFVFQIFFQYHGLYKAVTLIKENSHHQGPKWDLKIGTESGSPSAIIRPSSHSIQGQTNPDIYL